MNINYPTNLTYTNTPTDNSLQTRPVDIASFNTQQRNNDQTSLSDQAKMLQQREQRTKADMVNSLENNQSEAQEEEADESIRVSSSIGKHMTAGNFTKTEAVDLYRSIQNLL